MAGRKLTAVAFVLLVVAVVAGKPESYDEEILLNNNNEVDGGFPSLDGMLHWAIGNSDPEKLEIEAKDIEKLSIDELQRRQMELKELVEKLEMPSDAKLMKIAIDDLSNSSLSLEDRQRALEELLILVEAIDNANDLNKMGGLSLVIGELSNSDSGIRTTSAWIVGKASQNNPVVQNQVLELGALPKLMMMVKSGIIEEATKALYAVSAVIRNNQNGVESFYSEGGESMFQSILSNATADVRLQRRSVSLIADLAEYQLEYSSKLDLPFLSNCALVRPVIDLTASDDLDLQEKVLLAVKNLLMLKSNERLVDDGFCGLKGALERTRHQLQQLSLEEDHREYAMDVESLCKEVSSIYNEKLDKFGENYYSNSNSTQSRRSPGYGGGMIVDSPYPYSKVERLLPEPPKWKGPPARGKKNRVRSTRVEVLTGSSSPPLLSGRASAGSQPERKP